MTVKSEFFNKKVIFIIQLFFTEIVFSCKGRFQLNDRSNKYKLLFLIWSQPTSYSVDSLSFGRSGNLMQILTSDEERIEIHCNMGEERRKSKFLNEFFMAWLPKSRCAKRHLIVS